MLRRNILRGLLLLLVAGGIWIAYHSYFTEALAILFELWIVTEFLLLIKFTKGKIRKLLSTTLLWLLLAIALRTALVMYIISPEALSGFEAQLAIAGGSLVAALILLFVIGLILFYICSEWILGISEYDNVPRRKAMRLLISLIFELNYFYEIVADGEIKMASPGRTLLKLGGPGRVVVRPANAAVLEWGGQISHIMGPGMRITGLFERIKKPVDLRPQWGELTLHDVVTLEAVPLHLEARYCYRIETRELANIRPPVNALPQLTRQFDGKLLEGDENYDQGPIGRAVYEAGPHGWKKATEHAVEAALHDATRQWGIRDLFGDPQTLDAAHPEALRAVAQAACTIAWQRTTTWGVCVETVDILALKVPENLRERALAMWDAAAEEEIIEGLGRAEAHAMRAIEDVRAAGRTATLQDYAEVVQQIANQLSVGETKRFMALLEKLALVMAKDRTNAFRYLHTLEAISRNPNARIIVESGESSIIMDDTN